MSKRFTFLKSAMPGQLLRRFARDNMGSIAQIFALSALPVFMAAGAAVDGARISQEEAKFKAAVDAAVIAVTSDDRASTSSLSGEALTARMDELEDYAQDYLNANYVSQIDGAGDFTVDLTITGQKVELQASMEVPTTFMGLAGINSWTLTADSEVRKAMRPIELVMAMDTTGSMSNDGKIEGSKAAAHKLLETLYGGSKETYPQSEYIRVGLVPFAAAVRLDTSAYDYDPNWIDRTGANPLSTLNFDSTSSSPATWNNYTAWSHLKVDSSTYHTWNGCVEARDSSGSSTSGVAYNTADTPPSATDPASLFPAYFNPDTASYPYYDSRGRLKTSSPYGINYLGVPTSSGTDMYNDVGSECKGLSSTDCFGTSTSQQLMKQENYQKYDGAVVGAESTDTDGPWSLCTATKMVPMTYDRMKVENGVDAMVAAGNTVIPEGVAWGWRALSPTEPLSKVEGTATIPAATISQYGDARWMKILVLMTDGDNSVSGGNYSLNSSIYSAYGFGSVGSADNRFNSNTWGSEETQLDNDMATLCTAVKAKGIPIYVAAFGTGISTASKNRLKACSSGTSYYAEATSSADLTSFFNHIGEDVLSKAIYVSK